MEEVDEFGIPIKKASEAPVKEEVDDFGIPIKKKVPTTPVSGNGSAPTQPSNGSVDSRGRNPKVSFLADIVTELNPDAPKLKEGQSIDDWGKELTTYAKQYPVQKEGQPWKREEAVARMRFKLAQKNADFESFVDERLPAVEGMSERDKNLFLYKEYLKQNDPAALKRYEETRTYVPAAQGLVANIVLNPSKEDTERIDAEFYDKALEMSQNYLNIKYKKLDEVAKSPKFNELMQVRNASIQEMAALNESFQRGTIDRSNYESKAAAIKERYDAVDAEIAPVLEGAKKLQQAIEKNLQEAAVWINRFPAEAKRRMEEKAKNDFDEAMYALDPFRKMAANFNNQIGRGVTEFIANTFSLPQVFSQDAEYGWSDRLADVSQEWAKSTNDYLFPVPQKMNKGVVNKDMSVNWDLVFPKTVRTLTDMGIMASTGSPSGMVATSFVMNAKDYYDQALEQKMTPEQASKFSVSMAMQQSLLELINPEAVLIRKGLTKMASGDAIRMLSEGVSFGDAMKATAESMAKNVVMENVQEQAQLFSDMTGKMATNIITGSDFQFDDIGQQVKESLLLTSIVSGISSAGIGSSQNSRNELEKRAIYTAVDSPELLLAATQKAVAEGQLDPVAAQRINMTVGELKQNLDALPDNVKESERSEVVNALFDKNKLVQIAANESLDPAIRKLYEDKIKEIDTAVGKIIGKYVTPEKVEEVEKPTETEGVVEPVEVIVPSETEEVITETQVEDVSKKEEKIDIAKLNEAGKELFFEKPIRKEYEEGVDGDNKYAQDNIAHNEKVDNLILSINQNGTLIDSNGIEYDVEVTSQGVRVSPKSQNDLKVYAKGKRVSGNTPFSYGFKFIPTTEPAQSEQSDIERRTQEEFNNENESYRVIVGDEAFNDIVESGVVRTNADSKKSQTLAERLANRPTLFPSFSKGKASMEYAAANPNNYIIVTEDPSIQPSTAGRHGKGTTMFPTDENGNHLKELSGKKVKVYKHIGNGEYILVYANGKVIEQQIEQPAQSEAVKEDTTQTPTTDEKGNEKRQGQQELLNQERSTEDAAPIPEAPPLTPVSEVESTPTTKPNEKIFISKKGNSMEKDEEGKVIVRDKKGNELSGRDRSNVIGEFVREKIASKAGRVSDEQLAEDNVTEQNIAQYIADNSKNARQILETIANLRPDEVKVEKERVIDEAMTGVSKASFNSASDRNLMTDAIRENYIRKNGRGLDEIAQSASYAMYPDGDGTEISVGDVVEFIHNYPNGYKGKTIDNNKKALYDAFEQITGVRPTPAMIRALSSKKQMENDEDFAGLEPVETEGATVTVEGKEKEASFPKRVIADKKTSGQTKAKIDSARTYLEQKNVMSIGEATATIRDIGVEAAEQLVRDPLSKINGGVRGVMTQMIIRYYDENGEYEKAADLIRWAKDRLLDQGQEIQSYSLWNALRVGYTLQDSEREYEKVTGRKLPEYLRVRFEKIAEQVAKYEKRIAELEAAQKDKILNEAIGDIKESIDREDKKQPTRKKNELSAEKKSRKAELKKKFGGIFNDFTNIPRLLLDKEFIEYNKLILEEAAGDFKNFVRLIVDGLGKKARPYAREFYKAAGGTELPDLAKAFIDDNGLLKIPNEVIRDIVASGVTNADDLTVKVKEAIIKEVPDVTDREVKEAITQYGKTVNPSKDELDAEIRKLKRDGRLELGLEDAKEGKGVKRTGLQRDKPTDYQRELQRKINEELKKYPQDQQSVEKKWASALDRTKTHLKNTIADLTKRINDIKEGIAEPLPSKKRGFELDEEAKQLQSQKEELKKVLAELEPKQEMSDEQRVKIGIAAAERAIEKLAEKINQGSLEYKKKKDPLMVPELMAARERLAVGKDVLNRMREESGFAEQHRYDLWKKRINERINKLQKQLDDKDFSIKPKKVQEVTPEILDLRIAAEKLKFERDVAIEKERLKSLTGWDWWKNFLLDVANLPKSLMASADLSAPLRQGAILTFSNPIKGLAAAKEMMKQAFSEKSQQEWIAKLHASEAYGYMKHAKLFLSEPSVDLTAKEEQFTSNIAEKIPVWGKVVKGSGRAYNGYLNKLRADMFTQFYEELKRNGISGAELEKELASYAKFINNATGRGDLGIGETSALILNSAFFSPRYVASRFNLLNPVFYAKLEPKVRMEALKSVGIYIGITSATLALLSAMGDDDDDFTVELDPRSSDFGKLKWGDTRFDFWAGFQQFVRLFAQLATGERKTTTTGQIVKLGEGYKADTRLDVLRKFFVSKASPTAATLMNIMRGTDLVGNPTTIEDEAIKMVLPLYLTDMYNVYEDEGWGKATATALPAIFGVGVQTYGNRDLPTDPDKIRELMLKRKEKEALREMKKEKSQAQLDYEKKKDEEEEQLYKNAKKYKIEYYNP